MIRVDRKYDREYIFKLMEEGKSKINLDGDLVSISSARIKVFKKNHRCVKCGVRGKYFVKEKNENDKSFHLNLYANTKKGEILMTKDHIIPRSRGGLNHHSNYQTMCFECNLKKGNNI